MAKFPFIPTLDAHPEPAATAEVVEFPRDITAQAKLRSARRSVERCEYSIANDDLHSKDTRERVRAACSASMLPFWQDELEKAKAEVAMLDADDTLTFRGQMYRAHRSTSGAN